MLIIDDPRLIPQYSVMQPSAVNPENYLMVQCHHSTVIDSVSSKADVTYVALVNSCPQTFIMMGKNADNVPPQIT